MCFFIFIIMFPSLQPPSMRNTPFFYCFGLYTLGGFSRHVKSVHPLVNLVCKVSQVVFFFQVSFFPMILPSFIPLTSWDWFWAQSSSILGLFEFRFMCSHLFYKILQAIQNKVKQAFCSPLDQIAWDPTDKLVWFFFFLLSHWYLRYTQKGRSS